MNFDRNAEVLYRFEVYDESETKVVDSGLQGGPTYQITTTLAYKRRHTWRVRAERDGRVTAWSPSAAFISADQPVVGYIRGDEVFDPLHNGRTVGERIGISTFVANEGLRLETNLAHVRYVIPQTITAGEFSVEVMGLRPNAVGDRSKVFAMSTNSPDFITDPYRVDVQYRGRSGSPPNAITWRAIYGNAEDPEVIYEPDMATRNASVFSLNPDTVYYWKATWGAEFRVTLTEGGMDGRVIYDVGLVTPKGTYNPRPHYAYIGAPVGRSGAESATIPRTIYRNVWISSRPRPQ
jgi:hypothetical protein